MVGSDFLHIVLHHDLHELFEGSGLRVPSEFSLRLRGVAPQVDDVCRAVEVFADLDECLAYEVLRSGDAYAFLVEPLAPELEFYAGSLEGVVCELAHGVLLAGGDDEVFRRVVLQDEPHALYIVFRVAPVA